jgi:hypothetical protein
VKSTFAAKELELIDPPSAKVTVNGLAEYAINPVVKSVTVIGAYVAPTGTVTVSEVEVAELTVARTAPK